MFFKRPPEPEKSQLLGEDFDIFPSLDDTPAKSRREAQEAEGPVEPALADTQDDPEPTEFQKKIAEIPEKRWLLYQVLGGLALGGACGFFIYFGDKLLGGGITGSLIALAIAMVLPNLLEKQCARKIPRLRLAMCITLLVCLGGSLLLLRRGV